jgi:hypothetical protein
VPVEKIDVVFVPLLAYDKQGNRVGLWKRILRQIFKPNAIHET